MSIQPKNGKGERTMSYPKNWPRCPRCGEPVLDGHITCGRLECDERGERDKQSVARSLEQLKVFNQMFAKHFGVKNNPLK